MDPEVKEDLAEFDLEEDKDNEPDIEVVDDTPEKDRGRPVADLKEDDKPLSDEPGEDELKSYSAKVQDRIKTLTARIHAERRAKEAAARQLEEATGFGRKIIDENNRLKKMVHQGETVWKDTNEHRLAAEIERARQAYKAAYEEGDADAVAQAQEALTALHVQLDRTRSWDPQPMPDTPDLPAPRPQEPQVDPQALEWQRHNTWFGRDTEMTGFALGVHQRLVGEGVDPRHTQYYQRIDEEMSKRFPDKLQPKGTSQPNGSGGSSVVAPAKRTPKTSRKITLTASQVALAKKLGISPQQYAEEALKVQDNE